MADVRPFRGLRYNLAKLGALGPALCPPFDVISPQEEEALRGRSPYNAIRLELPHSPTGGDKYAVAAAALQEWISQQVLTRDSLPAFYISAHDFPWTGKTLRRHELTAAVRLEPLGSGSIKPHEDTRAGAKQDRLKLMLAAQANISPIMLLYQNSGEVAEALAQVTAGTPTVTADLEAGERFLTWVVTDTAVCQRIQKALAKESLYIADGHHRYETALNYRDHLAQQGQLKPDSAANFVMATLISMHDPGLLSLPYHRVLKGLDKAALAKIRTHLDADFVETKHNVAWAPPPQVAETALEHLATSDSVFEGYGFEAASLSSFRPRRTELLDRVAAGAHSRAWAALAPSIFSAAVLRPALGIGEEEAERTGLLTFAKDASEAVHAVNKGEAQLAFLPKAVPMTALKEVSDRGERLPPKATYFHPKLPTGLVINPLAGAL